MRGAAIRPLPIAEWQLPRLQGAGGAVFLFSSLLIEKSNPARAQDRSAGDDAVRRILARSIVVRCAPRFPR